MNSNRLLFLAVVLLLISLYPTTELAASHPTHKFHVRNFPDIVQGMSLSALKGVVGKLNRNCPQKLERSTDDPAVYIIYICQEPQVYLSFCNDELYWASTFRRGGFGRFVREIKTYKRNSAMAAYLKVRDVAAKTGALSNGAVINRDELSVQLHRDEYTLTMTLTGNSTNGIGVESEIRMDFQANLDPNTCR